MRSRELARGKGWLVRECVCTSGPADAPFEEQHRVATVAAVLSGSFRCRTGAHDVLLTPGSLFLGSPGQVYECSHELGRGDRCVSVSFDEGLLEEAASQLGGRRAALGPVKVPVTGATAAVVARAGALADGAAEVAADELAQDLLAAALGAEAPRPRPLKARELRRAHEAARHLEERAAQPHPLPALAAQAGLSPFHFLRTFRAALGTTPHQYLLGVRLRRAARALLATDDSVTEIALDAGFGDLSNFIRTFRRAAGRSPGALRRARAR